MKSYFLHTLTILLILCACPTGFAQAQVGNLLNIAIPKTLDDIGIVNVLVEDFEKLHPGTSVRINSHGAIRVLEMAADGHFDMILSHYPKGEELFHSKELSQRHAAIMYNSFVILGPDDSGLDFNRAVSLTKVLLQLRDGNADFLVPHRASGTYQRLSDLLTLSKIHDHWEGFQISETDVATTIQMADEMEMFTFSDISSYLSIRETLSGTIRPLFRDDIGLRNQISAIVVSAKHFPHLNTPLAERFWFYLVSERAQHLIDRFGEQQFGARVFTPVAHLDPAVKALKTEQLLTVRDRQLLFRNISITLAIALAVLFLSLYVKLRTVAKQKRISEARFFIAMDGSDEGIWDWDIKNNHAYVSKRCHDILGREGSDETLDDFLGWLGESLEPGYLQGLKTKILRHIENNISEPFTYDLRIQRQGAHVPARIRARVILGGNRQSERLVGAITDLSDAVSQQELLDHYIYLATHDSMTGLPNRGMLLQHMERALATADRLDLELAVILLDLNNFKHVNDELGHPVGDELLIEVAQRLDGRCRESDLVARLGGDEFVVLLNDVSREHARTIATAIAADIGGIKLPGYEREIQASLGLARFPADGKQVDQLLKCADSAMYQAKKQKSHIAFYSDTAQPV